jgi:hypothetical protein
MSSSFDRDQRRPDGDCPGRQRHDAAGSTPATLPIPGVELPGVATSDGAFLLPEVPRRIVIVGGSAVGAEWATMLNAFGTATRTFHERVFGDTSLPLPQRVRPSQPRAASAQRAPAGARHHAPPRPVAAARLLAAPPDRHRGPAQAAQQDTPELEPDADLEAVIAECDTKLAQYRAIADAGGDPAMIASWTADVMAQRAAGVARRTITHKPNASNRLSEAELYAWPATSAASARRSSMPTRRTRPSCISASASP